MQNIAEVNFNEKAKQLLGDMFKWTTYRKMPKVLAIIIGILTCWLALISLVLYGALWILIFLANIAELPANYIRGIMHGEVKGLHPAPLVVVYFFAWPVVVLLYVYAIVVVVMEHIFFAITHIFMWLWSLGGFAFHPLAY